MLGLDQQVGGEALRVGAVVGDDQALGRPEQHHRGDAVALQLDLGERDGRRAGPDDLAHLGDRLGAEAERGDAGRAVDAEHVGDAELAAHDEHGRVDRTVTAGDRRHDERDVRHAGDDRRDAELVHDARVARLAGRHEEPGRRDRADLLADPQPGLRLEAPVGRPRQDLLVERPAVGDRVVERGVDRRRHDGGGDLVGRDAQLVRRQRDAVEAGERVAHRGVAALADVLDQRARSTRAARGRRCRRARGRTARPGPPRPSPPTPSGASRVVHRRRRYRPLPSECFVHSSVTPCGGLPAPNARTDRVSRSRPPTLDPRSVHSSGERSNARHRRRRRPVG